MSSSPISSPDSSSSADVSTLGATAESADKSPAILEPQGRGVKALLGRTWIRAFGWNVVGGTPVVDKAVVVAAPHTSNWDLPFTIATAWVLGVKIRWVGKHTLFKPPFGIFLKLLGGVAVDRRTSNNAVEAIASVVASHDKLLLIIPPEGTRSKAGRWKTGFYWIAVKAEVPIILGFVDYGNKETGLGHIFEPTGDIESDFERLREFYGQKRGKFPELSGEITLSDDEPR